MRVLVLTTLFPNAAAPNQGVFVENRLRAVIKETDADVRVIAPVPWFPLRNKAFGKYADFARAPQREVRHGVDVRHPRYAIPPKIGMTYAAKALETCFFAAAQSLIDEGWVFDLIDGHYLYPDGVAAVNAARRLGKPVIITARGSDVSLIPTFPRQKRMILDAVQRADAVVSVAADLKNQLTRLGAPPEKINVLRNGVDLQQFSPLSPKEARAALKDSAPLPDSVSTRDSASVTETTGASRRGPLLVSAGHLIARKGHDLVIDALADCRRKGLEDARLLIVGAGPLRSAIENHAAASGVANAVAFTGSVPHALMPAIFSMADILVLASTHEGWPNVLLEAMACGTPVVTAPVGGCPEVVTQEAAGRVAAARTANAFSEAIIALWRSQPNRDATRRYAEKYSWRETATDLGALFSATVASDRGRKTVKTQPITVQQPERPRLLVTVDTEEAFDWNNIETGAPAVLPPDGIKRFQSLCETFSARPLYFLSYPIVSDAENAAYFRALCENGRADAGLHMHQWTVPPTDGYRHEFFSFQKNLPLSLYQEKLTVLAAAFHNRLGRRAISHRAGRYGVDASSYDALAAVGVTHDFSPSPGFDQSAAGGPDFKTMSNAPFLVETANGQIAVTPVSGARAIRGGRNFRSQGGAPGFVAKGGDAGPGANKMTSAMRLTCEGARLDDLKALTQRLMRDKTPIMTFSLHSTSLTAGGNRYAPDSAATQQMLDLTRDFLSYFVTEVGGEIIGLSDVVSAVGPQEIANPAVKNISVGPSVRAL